MDSTSKHLYGLIGVLVIVGIVFTLLARFSMGLPFSPAETQEVWTVEANLTFDAKEGKPIKAEMYIPDLQAGYQILRENFIAGQYGIAEEKLIYNRRAIYSTRRAEGQQSLYYRVSVREYKKGTISNIADVPAFTNKPRLEGAYKEAAEGVVTEIRDRSADIDTFTSMAIKLLNLKEFSNARFLVGENRDPASMAQLIVDLLAVANIPARVVYGIPLETNKNAKPTIMIATSGEEEWSFYDPTTGQKGLPPKTLIWWIGDGNLYHVRNGINPQLTFSVFRNDMPADKVVELANKGQTKSLYDFTTLKLPVSTQQTYQILLMVPVGVLAIMILRSFVGVPMFGTFMPALIAMSFRDVQLELGIIMFVTLVGIGILVRLYLDKLHLLLVPRLAVILTVVVISMLAFSILGNNLGIQKFLSISLFPMVILTMVIERMSVVWEERGPKEAMIKCTGSLITAVVAYFAMNNGTLSYLIFTFPSLLLVFMALMLLAGRYRGYQLSELLRFKAMLGK